MLANFAVPLPLALQLTMVRLFIQNRYIIKEHCIEYMCAFEEHLFALNGTSCAMPRNRRYRWQSVFLAAEASTTGYCNVN